MVGILHPRTPPAAARTALLLGVPLYAVARFGGLVVDAEWMHAFNSIAFLHHMAMIFVVLVVVMLVMTARAPLAAPLEMPVSRTDATPHPRIKLYGGVVVALTAVLYAVFW